MTPSAAQGPLPIATVAIGHGLGEIGFGICPGRVIAPGEAAQRDLAADLDAVQAWGAAAVVTLVTDDELRLLGVTALGEAVERRGLAWMHVPIVDFSVPDAAFEQRWTKVGTILRQKLAQRRRVLLHCRGGLGRSGMIAARILVEYGWQPAAAIAAVREARPGAIETEAQERAVHTAALPAP